MSCFRWLRVLRAAGTAGQSKRAEWLCTPVRTRSVSSALYLVDRLKGFFCNPPQGKLVMLVQSPQEHQQVAVERAPRGTFSSVTLALSVRLGCLKCALAGSNSCPHPGPIV